jgi:hypothetical protein
MISKNNKFTLTTLSVFYTNKINKSVFYTKKTNERIESNSTTNCINVDEGIDTGTGVGTSSTIGVEGSPLRMNSVGTISGDGDISIKCINVDESIDSCIGVGTNLLMGDESSPHKVNSVGTIIGDGDVSVFDGSTTEVGLPGNPFDSRCLGPRAVSELEGVIQRASSQQTYG